jgi:hypothetical protein
VSDVKLPRVHYRPILLKSYRIPNFNGAESTRDLDRRCHKKAAGIFNYHALSRSRRYGQIDVSMAISPSIFLSIYKVKHMPGKHSLVSKTGP